MVKDAVEASRPVDANASRRGERALDRRLMAFSTVLFLASVALVRPSLEMGVNDDWSYTRTAAQFAATGHFSYNGGSSVTILPQVYWAALFIKLFGFSFFAVRFSTILLTVCLIPALYHLSRESGLRPSFAAFGVLLCIFSPLMLPEEISFMTDIPALLPFVVSVLASVRAWRSESARTCIGWMCLSVVAGIVSALERQVYWLAPLLFPLAIAFAQRRRRSVSLMLLGFCVIAFCACVWAMRWADAQPYFRVEPWFSALAHTSFSAIATRSLAITLGFGLTAALLLLPVLVAFIPRGLTAVSRQAAAALVIAVIAVCAIAVLYRGLQAPWLGNVVTEFGAIPLGMSPFGEPPLVLGPAARLTLTFGVMISLMCVAIVLKQHRKRAVAELLDSPAMPAVTLGLIFAAGWLPAVLLRSVSQFTFDRYLISLLPVLTIPLLCFLQTGMHAKIGWPSWAALGIFAAYSVCVNHDAFASARARLETAKAMERAGIPRTDVVAGVEFDGWTQLDEAGYLNEPHIVKPAGAYRHLSCIGDEAWHWYFSLFSTLRPRYALSLSRLTQFSDAPVQPVRYTTWLPPGEHHVFTYALPDSFAGCR